MNKIDLAEPTYSLQEAAKIYGVSRNTLRIRLLTDKKLIGLWYSTTGAGSQRMHYRVTKKCLEAMRCFPQI